MKKTLMILTVTICLIIGLTTSVFAEGLSLNIRQMSTHNSFLPSEQTLGGYFGLGMGTSAEIIFGLDWYKFKVSTDVNLLDNSTEASVSAGSMQFHGGLKFYMGEVEEGEVSPYILGEIFYGIGSVSLDAGDESISSDPLKDLLSPYGIVAAFGASYFASEKFSVGGEIGVRISITESSGLTDILGDIELPELQPGFGKIAVTASEDDKVKLTTTMIYTAITLGFSL